MLRDTDPLDLELVFHKNRVKNFFAVVESGRQVTDQEILTAFDDLLHLGDTAKQSDLARVGRMAGERNISINTPDQLLGENSLPRPKRVKR